MLEPMLPGIILLLLVAAVLLIAAIAAYVAYLTAYPPRRTEGAAIANGWPTDPQALGYTYEQIMIEPVGAVWVVEGEAPDGPTVVVCHGWADSRYGVLNWLEAIAPWAKRVVLYDQRGHGDSPHRRCTLGHDEATDTQAVVRAMRNQHGNEPVVLLGASLGALVVLRAVSAGAEVAGVVLDSPLVYPSDASKRMVQTLGLPTWLTVPIAWWLLGRLAGEGYRRNSLEFPLPDGVPTLILQGEADTITPLAHTHALIDRNPHARLELFTGCGHVEPVSEQPDRYAALIAEWWRDGSVGTG